MLGETNSGMQCAEFDALLAEAIDGSLTRQRREDFERHKAGCAACGKLFAEVTSGLAWIEQVEDIEPPRNLVHNILAATTGAAQQDAQRTVRVEVRASAWERLRRQLGTVFEPVLTPRFAMSMGMALFSLTLVLNMAQIRIMDLTPHNLSHTFYSNENKLVKHYENMRVVYEIESRVRDLRNSSRESEREQRDRLLEKNNNQTQNQNQVNEPDARRQREFSRGESPQLLASLNGSEQCFGTYRGNLAKLRREI
jgi:hypothetical protein